MFHCESAYMSNIVKRINNPMPIEALRLTSKLCDVVDPWFEAPGSLACPDPPMSHCKVTLDKIVSGVQF